VKIPQAKKSAQICVQSHKAWMQERVNLLNPLNLRESIPIPALCNLENLCNKNL